MGSPEDREAFSPPPAFSIEAAAAGPGTRVLTLAGELDLATSGEFRRHVDEACAAGSQTVVVDLSDVGFVDSTMLRELLRARHELEGAGARLVLAGVQPAVLRLLDLTGTAEMFELAHDREAALGERR